LPQAAWRLIDHSIAVRSDSPAASLALATSREDIAEPPSAFGAIRPKHMLTVGRHLEEMTVEIRQPFPRDQMLRELDDGEDDEHEPLVFDVSSPVGGGGALGRLLKRLLSDTRSSTGGGPPGADAPTHLSKRSTGGGRTVAVSAARATVTDDTGRSRPELAVLVLLDVSGSAAEPSATGVPVHEHQRAAAAALTVALHDLGDRVALYAFRSQGRSAVHVLPVKRFDDSFDARV